MQAGNTTHDDHMVLDYILSNGNINTEACSIKKLKKCKKSNSI